MRRLLFAFAVVTAFLATSCTTYLEVSTVGGYAPTMIAETDTITTSVQDKWVFSDETGTAHIVLKMENGYEAQYLITSPMREIEKGMEYRYIAQVGFEKSPLTDVILVNTNVVEPVYGTELSQITINGHVWCGTCSQPKLKDVTLNVPHSVAVWMTGKSRLTLYDLKLLAPAVQYEVKK